MSNENDKSKLYLYPEHVEFLGAGISEIWSERQKQIDKHGYSAKWQAEHPQYYADGQLIHAASILIIKDLQNYEDWVISEPHNWDRARFMKLCRKPEKDRIRISAALLVAELDRLKYISDNNL